MLRIEHLDADHMIIEEQRNVFFRANEGLFLRVSEFLRLPRGLLRLIRKFLHDLADIWIQPPPDSTHRPHAHLAGAISPEHRAILNERHFAAHASRGNCGAHASITAADNHQIILSGFLGLVRNAQHLAPPFRERLTIVWRNVIGVFREVNGIAPAIEAGEIMQSQSDGHCTVCGKASGGRDFHRSPILPKPIGALCAKRFRKRLSSNPQLEFSRRAGRFPLRHPILRAHVHMILPSVAEFHGRDGVLHGLAHAVREQIRRSHAFDELCVEHPAAGLLEAFGFDKDLISAGHLLGGCANQNAGARGARQFPGDGIPHGRLFLDRFPCFFPSLEAFV